MNPLIPFALIACVFGAVVFVLLLKRGVESLIRYRANSVTISIKDPLLASLSSESPTLIYFTGAHCGPCKTTQAPIIRQLTKERGEAIQLITVDIEEQMDTALRWGVLKVPSTIVLNRQHEVVARNLDVAMLPLLRQQLDAANE